jgi:uncharacterized membrane protein
MKKNPWLTLFIVAITLVPCLYLAIVWNSIPQTVALHFDQHMEPDRTGDKSSLWLVTGIIAIVSIGTYFLLKNISKFDPKQRRGANPVSLNKLGGGLVVFLAALSIIIINSSYRGMPVMGRFLFPLLGLLLAFIGNCMNSIKPNYFAGFRLPWTLSDDDNWRRTHQLAAKIWFAGGLLITIIGIALPAPKVFRVFIILMVIMVIIPSVYSYKLFREKKMNGEV